ncbi:MAG: methyltransferase domain-containing protein [Cyanobacteria bacterium P01_D01_bin.156]
MSTTTQQIYDQAAAQWVRTEKVLLSDFTARPFALEALEPMVGANVLDLGCGEGYLARQMRARGASAVLGIELSEEMVGRAQIATDDTALSWQQGSATDLMHLQSSNYDRIAAIFLFNYLTRAEMTTVLSQARRLLKAGGKFVFTVPHPSLPWLRPQEYPFFFNPENSLYMSDRDRTLEGRIWRRDGIDVPVRCVHKTLEDYFVALRTAGWTKLPVIKELAVQPEHIDLDPDFFGPLLGTPLHMLFVVEH